MSENFLHYLWFGKLFFEQQQTTDGQPVEVIDVGIQNTDAGPDVFNAKVKIGGMLWAGNVEFHPSANDWKQHGHGENTQYNSVILHVVLNEGKDVVRTNQTIVPQMIMQYPKHLEQKYQALKMPFIACASQMAENQPNNIAQALEILAKERLERKVQSIEALLAQTGGDWEEAFYITTARSFGFGTNATAFELLAKNLPQKILAKQKNNLLQIEALLFGVGGMLEKDVNEQYYNNLQNEFEYLKHKFSLKPLDAGIWKFLRLRPANFPTIRIAQFAVLLSKSSKLFSKIIEQKNYNDLLEYFSCYTSDYWKNHYVFGKISTEKEKKLAKSSIDIILINSIIPFLYAYGKKFVLPDYQYFAMNLLKKIPAEKNHISNGFSLLNINANNALETQALTELKNQFCDRKDCVKCKNKFNIS